VFGEISLLKYYRSLPNATKALFASFEGRGRKGLGGEGKGGKGERRKSLPLVWKLKKPIRK